MHWRNSAFQTTFFIAGKCKTPDEAYRVLLQQLEERDVAIKNAHASKKKEEAKVLKAEAEIRRIKREYEKVSTEFDEEKDESRKDDLAYQMDVLTADILEKEGDLLEVEAFKQQTTDCYFAALEEYEFIKSLIDKIKPLRKYKELPENEAHQMAQWEEWREELKKRAENFLQTQGFIPHDHLETMKAHPEWGNISQHIEYARLALQGKRDELPPGVEVFNENHWLRPLATELLPAPETVMLLLEEKNARNENLLQ